ncbi:MAG: hypothetical protein IJP27_02735 [Clostridia bacterium]|nr:hypothetical protein [Clostridia bacterium]
MKLFDSVTIDLQNGQTHTSAGTAPLFRIGQAGKSLLSTEAACRITEDGAVYTFDRLTVRLSLSFSESKAEWRIQVTEGAYDHVDFPLVLVPSLKTGGKVLIPYNEGLLLEDETAHHEMYREPGYPSQGNDFVFPNMVSAQMMAYLTEEGGLYLGAHDPRRGVKGIDIEPHPNGVLLRMRLYGETDFPIVWKKIGPRWEDAAEEYRQWFEQNLPPRVKKIKENDLPDWYRENPLVVSYPVRGKFDTDEMTPNALFPYCNALPVLDRIAHATAAKLMVLLMHWEGTAPWAPPYVWPPYGGEEPFNAFRDALHKRGHLLGVYCSGFGYTTESNLTDYKGENIPYDGICTAEDGVPRPSPICTKQRKGHDLCPVSKAGRRVVEEAYLPLLQTGIDYAQILDQNHGGGQYFCHNPHHGHPTAPGAWMTESMQTLLGEWNDAAPQVLLGCESAAGEPFLGNLLFSDNRYPSNYRYGTAVPLHSYLFHEYLRNFMGNQCCSPFLPEEETLCYRLAYSFAAGDALTLMLTPEGKIEDRWGQQDFSVLPDQQRVLTLTQNLLRFYREKAGAWLYDGRMIPPLPVDCKTVSFTSARPIERKVTLPALLTTAWENEQGKVQILVNPEPTAQTCRINGQEITVPPLDGILLCLQ